MEPLRMRIAADKRRLVEMSQSQPKSTPATDPAPNPKPLTTVLEKAIPAADPASNPEPLTTVLEKSSVQNLLGKILRAI